MLTLNSTKMEGLVLILRASALSCIPSISNVPTAEVSFFDRPLWTHWEDELLLQASQVFSDEEEESLC